MNGCSAVLTVDYNLLGLRPGERLLDVGCGQGRHTIEALRRGARVWSVDLDRAAIAETVTDAGAWGPGVQPTGGGGAPLALLGDATRLPFADGAFDRVICAETLEHIPADRLAIAELTRVLRPGGRLAITVPRFFPERICWALSREYRETPGGHVRIYRATDLAGRVRQAGLHPLGRHHEHALHSPYWWLRCAIGPPEEQRLSRWYERLLEWDMLHQPTPLGRVERWLNPLLGKSVALYFERPAEPA